MITYAAQINLSVLYTHSFVRHDTSLIGLQSQIPGKLRISTALVQFKVVHGCIQGNSVYIFNITFLANCTWLYWRGQYDIEDGGGGIDYDGEDDDGDGDNDKHYDDGFLDYTDDDRLWWWWLMKI
jgi:hypothetical protein